MKFCSRPIVWILASLGLWALAGYAFAQPSPVLNATRATAKAPALVMFDGFATTDISTTKPIHHLTYCFDAGDGNVATYSNAGHKTIRKNQFCGGPAFAYVYETPGLYTATLTVWNAAGQSAQDTVTITITDYTAAETECISSSGTFTDCPYTTGEGATHTTSSAMTAVNTCLSGRNQCLLRAGETFTTTGGIAVPAGKHIGAYGTANNGRYIVSGNPGGNLWDLQGDDVRIADGQWTGTATSRFVNFNISPSAAPDFFLMQNWDLNIVKAIVQASETVGDQIPSNIGFFSNVTQDCGNDDNNCIFVGGTRFALVDNVLQESNTGGQHNVRITHADRMYIVGNKFALPAPTKHHLTIRTWNYDVYGLETFYTLIADNWFEIAGTSDVPWPLQLGAAQGTNNTAFHNDYVVERNYCTNQPQNFGYCIFMGTGSGTTTNRRHTIRNNVAQMGGASQVAFFGGGAGTDIEFYNNSVHSTDSSSSIWGSAGTSCSIFRNNVIHPAARSITQGCTTSSNNWAGGGGDQGTTALSQNPYTGNPPTAGVPSTMQINPVDPDGLINGGFSVPHRCSYGEQVGRDAPDVGAWEVNTDSAFCRLGAVPVPISEIMLIVK